MVFLVRLHVGRQGSCRVVPSGTGRALIRFLRVVRFHMDLQMVAIKNNYYLLFEDFRYRSKKNY